MNILYITYDGIVDHISQSQILPYLEGLSKAGNVVTILSFEKKDRIRASKTQDSCRERLRENNIGWIPKRYHKKPVILATLFDLLQAVVSGVKVIKAEKIDAIHARGYIPMLMACILKKILCVKVLFDMRGFWPEEKVDALAWKKGGATYLVVKKMEAVLIRMADEIVVLTASARNIIEKEYHTDAPITVIPCGTDLERFKPSSGKRPAFDFLRDRRVVLYNGSLGTFYNLNGIFDFFRFLKIKNDSFFLWIISNDPQEAMAEEIVNRYNINPSNYRVDNLDYMDIPAAFSYAEVSVVFYRRALSGKGCCPIKIGESLACGVPVIISPGIGDCDDLMADNDIGTILKDFCEDEYSRALGIIDRLAAQKEATRKRCQETAKKFFSLKEGIDKYREIYNRLKGPAPT